ncbi:uncharacterized protein B0J16DRAFT_272754 [Fusarium flagelliforme]|uniref:uncharacterized protein n=1 Tax=Fusarium flagelliforme TaxID=2675880 RepID=UPI001E8E1CEB|nr:uncharacterized protein B0J16DRAFT_272754 [Fusarium flagelliforme]KAH7179495.1 hypothetical protein B0J16DRAFT_272754 [Fusarium flagelliforme]
MTRQRADPLADELALDWGDGAIYCEATCDPEDIYYEGSDDEDYESSAARKIRYEAAGQRFLDGKTPLILTAILKGPFEPSETNWVNPWRSKHRTAEASARIRTSPGKLSRSAKVKRKSTIPETVRRPHDSLECHLPSPESLNQTSETEPHPYLEQDELVKVQQWRDSVKSGEEQRDRFWTSTPQTSASERKRKANGSSWLKLLTNKRRRTDVMDSGSVDTPIRPKPQLLSSATNAKNTTFTSDRGHLSSSAVIAERYISKVQNEASEDELSRDDAESDQAPADSSSPLSHLQYTPVLDPEVNFLSQGTSGQQTPSKTHTSRQQLASKQFAPELQNIAKNILAISPTFETQEDESFCFKMRQRSNQDDKATPDEDEPMAEGAEETWSGLSSHDQYMDSIVSISDLKASTPTEELVDPQTSNLPVDAAMSGAANSSSSSSISSKELDESKLPKEVTHSTANITSKPSSVTGPTDSDTELSRKYLRSSTTSPIETRAPEGLNEGQRGDEVQDVDMQETTEASVKAIVPEPQGAAQQDGSETESADDSNEDVSEEASEEDIPEVKEPAATSDNTPQIAIIQQAGTAPSGKLEHENSDSPSVPASFPQQTSSSRRNTTLAGPASSPVRVFEKEAGTRSTQSTPSMANGRQISNSSQSWNHDASPTIVNTPMYEQHLEQRPNLSHLKKDAPISFSQQSPWVANKFSQYAKLSLGPLLAKDTESVQTGTGHAIIPASPIEQTPWTDETTELHVDPPQRTPIAEKGDQQVSHESTTPVVEAEGDAGIHEEYIAATPAEAATPEPQFSVRSFASFGIFSPERKAQQAKRTAWRKSGSGLPSTQAILASATKNPWESNTSERRVSFAPLPDMQDPESSMPATPCPSLSRRQGSPPPNTPTSELPTSEGDKFQKHFNAVARGPIIRRHHRLLPSESQRTVGSPLPDAMADAFLSTDQLRQQTTFNGPAKSDRESDESQDPFDMVADIMREEFDQDSGMEVAIQSPIKTQGQQSPW